MNYIVQNTTTKELFYSKGASKLAEMIGISEKTIQRNAKHTFTEKVYNGFIFAKAKIIPNKNRGTNIKDELSYLTNNQFIKSAKTMKEQLKTINEDLEIVIEAIKNKDTKEAIQMLEDIKEDLEIIVLMC